MMEIAVQIAIALIGIGTFVGTTKSALHSLERRLDKLEEMGHTFLQRLATVETKLDEK